MSYFIVVLLLIAPSFSVDQQKPDSGVKKGAVQEHASPKQQNPKQGQAPEKPKDATEVFNYANPVEAPAGQTEKRDTYDPRHDALYRAYLWFTILGVPVALGGLYMIYRQTNHISDQPSTLRVKSRFSKGVLGNG